MSPQAGRNFYRLIMIYKGDLSIRSQWILGLCKKKIFHANYLGALSIPLY